MRLWLSKQSTEGAACLLTTEIVGFLGNMGCQGCQESGILNKTLHTVSKICFIKDTLIKTLTLSQMNVRLPFWAMQQMENHGRWWALWWVFCSLLGGHTWKSRLKFKEQHILWYDIRRGEDSCRWRPNWKDAQPSSQHGTLKIPDFTTSSRADSYLIICHYLMLIYLILIPNEEFTMIQLPTWCNSPTPK